MRGCPYGGYFSSQASTLPAADKTGNLTIRPFSIVHSIVYDKQNNKASGVHVIDAETKETLEFHARIIFCNASTLGTTSILLQSKSDRFPNGMGNDSGELGHNLMDHHFKVGARGKVEGFLDKYYKGKRPNGIYMPRFRNLDKTSKMTDFIRGYGYQGGSGRYGYFQTEEEKFGATFKQNLSQPGHWTFNFSGFGEMLPYHENMVELDYENLDKWGLPTLVIDCEMKENELNMRKDMRTAAAEMLETCGLKNVQEWEYPYNPGNGIHEMGTARMGKDPKTSVLNKFNQIHAVKNVFITDGSCMTSSACQNPSLSYMALTARACHYAVEELKKQNL
jgi:choline dehydrogenase-like flavoprotein